MAVAVLSIRTDLIEDSGLSTINGIKTIRRIFNVSGIASFSGADVLTQAELAPLIPRYGDGHPVYNYCIVRSIEVNPLVDDRGRKHPSAARVICTYQGNADVSVTFGSTLQQVTTDTNKDGKEMRCYWSGNTVKNSTTGKVSKFGQRCEVPKFARNDYIIFRHWYVVKNKDLSYPTPIEVLKQRYLGKVNGGTFRGRDANVWMCTQCDGETPDYGRSYEITIKLEARTATLDPKDQTEDGWSEYAWYHLANGEVPHSASKKTRDGVRKCDDIYDQVDFNNIGDDLANLNNL